MNYRDYLISPQWKRLSAQARERAGNRCEHCGRSPDHVHHVRYPKNLADDVLENLIVVCASCHAKHHGIRGEKMSKELSISFDGHDIHATFHDDEVWMYAPAVYRAIEFTEVLDGNVGREMVGRNYEFAINQLDDDQKKRFEVSQSDGASRVEWFVNESGAHLMALNSRSKKAKPFKRFMADVGVSIRKFGCYPPPAQAASKTPSIGAALVAQAQAIFDLEQKIERQDILREEMRTELVGMIENVKETVDEYMRTADWIRSTGKKADESKFGYFLAQLASREGGKKGGDGWYSSRGEQLSRSLPAPDTRFSVINKWRITFMEYAWPKFGDQSGTMF